VDGILADGQQVRLGHTTLTIHVTPGHTRGCTSWTMTTHVDGKPEQVLFVCSVSVMAQYRLVGKESYPGIAQDYARSIATLQALPCDIMLGPHGSFFDLTDKVQRLQYGGANPFIDPDGCKGYLTGAAIQFQRALQSQQAGANRKTP
jgi:metallo-beta-lactamase class B